MFSVERDPLIEFMRTISKIDVGKLISRSTLRGRCCEFDFATLILRVDVVTVRSRNRYCEIDVVSSISRSVLPYLMRVRCCKFNLEIDVVRSVLILIFARSCCSNPGGHNFYIREAISAHVTVCACSPAETPHAVLDYVSACSLLKLSRLR